MLQFDNIDVGHWLHYRQRRKLDYIYEHMASFGSLDVVNLPTKSANTKMSLPRDDFTNQNQSYSCSLVDTVPLPFSSFDALQDLESCLPIGYSLSYNWKIFI